MTCASDAYVLTWVSANNEFECLASGGAGTSIAGDVTGSLAASTVVKFQNRAFASTAPSDTNTICWDPGGATWKPSRPVEPTPTPRLVNMASVAITLTGVAADAVVACYDNSTPPRQIIPDSVVATDANTVTVGFIPNATGYCNSVTTVGQTGATGATGAAGAAGPVSSTGGTVGQIPFIVNSTTFLGDSNFLWNNTTKTLTVGTSLSADSSTGIATTSKIGNAAISLLTGAGKFSSGVPIGQAACADLSNAAATCSSAAIGGITGMGTGVGTFLVTPSSANLAAALTDETGSGAAVFANTPTLVTPVIGAATGAGVDQNEVTSGSGSGVGGAFDMAQGTLPSIVANTVSFVAPTSVTGYEVVAPGVAATGFRLWTNAANVVTESILADPLAIGHGGTGTASTLTGLVRGSGSAMTGAELTETPRQVGVTQSQSRRTPFRREDGRC